MNSYLRWRCVKGEFSRTGRRARLFLCATSFLNTRCVSEFDKFIAKRSATAAAMGNIFLFFVLFLFLFLSFFIDKQHTTLQK